MNTITRISSVLVAASALIFTSPVVQASQPEEGELLNYTYDEMDTDLGSLHLFLYPVAYHLASHSGGMMGASGAFELGENLMVRGSAFVPNAFFGFDEFGPDNKTTGYRIEAAVQFHNFNLEMLNEAITTKQSTSGNMVTTETLNVPVASRTSRGLGGGIISRGGGASIPAGGKDSFETIGHHLTVFGGIQIVNSSAYEITVENRGTFSDARWVMAGFDAMFDVVQSYDIEPDDSPGRWGGRFWTEATLAKFFGMSARLELGKQPGGSGWYMLAAFGGGLNLL